MFDYLKSIFKINIDLPFTEPVFTFGLLLAIILIVPLIFRKIKLPAIIGLILAGVLIGGNGLNIIPNDGSLKIFSEIGLLYIMFIAGLELDLTQFKSNKYKSIVLGTLTFIIPILICFPTFRYFLNFPAESSFLISIMLSSYTLISYPIVSKLGITQNRVIPIVVGATIVTDMAVLLILAVVLGENKDSSLFGLLSLLIGIILFLVFMFLVVPRISKLFFRKLESEKYSHYIYVLLVIFIAGIFAKIVGLEPIIGAFLTGLALNSQIPRSSLLMNRISFVGNAIFIPIFLITIGMMINFRILNDIVILEYFLILGLIAIFGKWIAAFLTQKIFKYKKEERQLIFGLISSKAAATLAVIIVGKSAGIIDERMLNATILLILLTCIVSSFVTERASLKIVLNEEQEDNKKRKLIFTENEHILIPIGNFATSERLLELSTLIINKSLKHEISLLSVVEADENSRENYSKNKKKLIQKSELLIPTDIKTNILVTIDHNMAGAITRVSNEIIADIIILGWGKSNNVLDKIIESTVENIVKNNEHTIFICDLKNPLSSCRKIVLISLPFSELEIGYILWFQKVLALSKELSIPIDYYCTEDTQKFSINISEYLKIKTQINYINPSNWKSLSGLKIKIQNDDLLIFTAIRKGAISYSGLLEKIDNRLQKYFLNNSKILIYSQEKNDQFDLQIFQDITSNNLNRGIEKLSLLKRIFKSKTDEK